MTTTQVNKDAQTIAAYIVIARRMANGPRTDWRGRNGGKVDRRVETVTVEPEAVHAPDEAAEPG
jgi:hypothetical protein